MPRLVDRDQEMHLMSHHLRVLDLTDPLAHQGARLLVGQGADVIRVQQAPPDPQPEAEALHWHAGKRVCTTSAVEDVVRTLLPGADVVLESGEVPRLRTLAMRDADPSLWNDVVHVVVTPFGLTGPWRGWRGDDLVLSAAGGMAWLGGQPGEVPEPPPRQQATQLAGAHAATAALLGLVARRRDGHGQLIDISVQEAVAATLETGAVAWIHGGTVPGRMGGVYGHVAHRVFAAADGYLAGGYSGSDRMWVDLLAWMTEEGEAEDLGEERWQDRSTRWEGRPHVDEVVARFFATRYTSEVAEEARRRALPWAEVIAPGRLPENPQLRSRAFFAEIADGPRSLVDVGHPYESPHAPRPVRLSAPRTVGDEVSWSFRASPNHQPAPTGPAAGAPSLDGLRVLDLTWVLAGPYATKTLGDHGAEIIKIESRHRQDPTRFTPGMRMRPGASHDESGYFLNFNRNKRSLALNLRHEQGPPLLRRLVAEVDVVVENFSPGVLAKWGLSYDELREINPRVVLVSMAGVGQTGPWRRAVTFADTLAAMSGLTSETATEGRPPTGLSFGLGDMIAANSAVLGLLELLLAGTGGHLDLSQLEALAAQLGPAVLEPQVERSTAEPARPALPRVLRTAGVDRWMAVGDATEAQLSAVLGVLTGQPVLADDSRDTDELVRALASAVADLDADEVADHLQRLGIGAYAVRDGRDLVEMDPQLAARGFYVELGHPLVGPVLHEGVVARMSETPGLLRTPAPLLGQHTDELLARLLGMSPRTIADLHEKGVLE
jgi:crotonobetainyl-CoA:carnitine CoA-transferase CaiB-like acyl-CoA transferase